MRKETAGSPRADGIALGGGPDMMDERGPRSLGGVVEITSIASWFVRSETIHTRGLRGLVIASGPNGPRIHFTSYHGYRVHEPHMAYTHGF